MVKFHPAVDYYHDGVLEYAVYVINDYSDD